MFSIRITDRLLVWVLFVVIGVLSTVTVLNLRENNSQTAKLRESIESQQILSGVGIICTLDTSGAVNTEKIPYTPEAIAAYVNDCIIKEAAKRRTTS